MTKVQKLVLQDLDYTAVEWPEFDAVAVRKVLFALVHLGKKEVVILIECVESSKAFVNHLIETREDF